MASEEVEFTQRKPSGFAKKMESTRKFMYNPAKKEVLGRTALSWGRIGLFYLVFYACLAGFFAALLAIFFLTIDENYPKLQDGASMLKANPGMGYRPMPDYESTLIHFEQGKPSSYKVYTDNIRAYMYQYGQGYQEGDQFVDCGPGYKKEDPKKVCIFDPIVLGDQCIWSRDYGYDEGKPCVLLKLNKVYNWQPDPYPSAPAPTKDPENEEEVQEAAAMKEMMDLGYVPRGSEVGVTCQGEHPSDKENIGPLKYYPDNGYNTLFFPFLNQEGYRSPLVFVQFQNITKGLAVQVWCRIWAKNIENSNRNLKPGSVHFEILVD